MKSKSLLLFAVLTAGMTASADPGKEAEIFRSTIREVDMNGVYLNYLNSESTIQMLGKLPEHMEKVLGPEINQQAKLGLEGGALLLKALNFQAVKAQASSSRNVNADLSVFKSYAYLGRDFGKSGIFDLLPQTNQPLAGLKNLPLDTRIAAVATFFPGKLWAQLKREFSQSANPALSALPALAEAQLMRQYQIKPDEFFDSIGGQYELLITGGIHHISIRLTVPDRNGVLTALLRRQLGIAPEVKQAALPFPPMPPYAPALLFEPGKVVAVSHPQMLESIRQVPGGGLMATADFAPLFRELPKDGIGFFVLHLDEPFQKEIAAAAPAVQEMWTVLIGKPSLKLVSATYAARQGFGQTVVSNISLPELFTALPLTAFRMSLLPALTQARRKAEAVRQSGRLKQLAVCVGMYSTDHPDKPLPEKLQTLAENMPGIDLSDMIWLGGGTEINKIKKPSTYPLALFHPAKTPGNIIVLFLDGHVAIEKTAFVCTTPDQALGALQRKYQFEPEILDALLQKAAGK